MIAVLRKEYSSQIKIKLKDTTNDDYWEFQAQGWVGYIPVCSELAIRIMPKIPIANLLGMLEYAYNLKSFRFFNSLTGCATLEDFYNCLVKLLCELILQISRQGLYKAYLSQINRLTHIRGKLDIVNTLKHLGNVKFVCHYSEQTTDILENQILLWTLYLISHHYLCHEASKSLVRKTYHALHNLVSLKSFTVLDLDKLQYNRLNRDYRAIHSLCHFFIANFMPNHNIGDNQMLPFIVNMAQLYEQFVAAWLKIHLPKHFQLNIQKTVKLTACSFKIDLIICDRETKKNIYVLDTKYKNSSQIIHSDLYQISTYAVSQNCDRAILIYPWQFQQPITESIGRIFIKGLSFALQDNLEAAGKTFLQALFIS